MPPSCLELCQLSVALRIKFRLPGLAPRIMHDLAPATPPVCLSPLIPQHLQLYSSSAHNASVPQTEQLFLTTHFPLCLPLPDMPLSALPGPVLAPAPPCEPPHNLNTPNSFTCLCQYTSETYMTLILWPLSGKGYILLKLIFGTRDVTQLISFDSV